MMMLVRTLACLLLLASAADAQVRGRGSPSCFPAAAGLTASASRWFCGELAAAGKTALQGDIAYRFTLLQSFRPARIVEIRHGLDGWTIESIVMTFRGVGPATFAHHSSRLLTADEAWDLRATVRRTGLWLTTVRPNTRVVTDGEIWLFEASRGGMYRVHFAGTPERDEDFQLRDLGDLMHHLAGMTPGPSRGYP